MPLFTCQGVTEYIGEAERCVCVKKTVCVCVLDLPASDEQSVLYRGHQLKVKAMLGLVARGPASEYRVPP